MKKDGCGIVFMNTGGDVFEFGQAVLNLLPSLSLSPELLCLAWCPMPLPKHKAASKLNGYCGIRHPYPFQSDESFRPWWSV